MVYNYSIYRGVGGQVRKGTCSPRAEVMSPTTNPRLNAESGCSSALSLLAGALLSYLDALGWTRTPVPTTDGSLTLARSGTAPSVGIG